MSDHLPPVETTGNPAASTEADGGEPVQNDNRRGAWLLAHQKALRFTIWGVVAAAIAGGTIAWLTGWLEPAKIGYSGVFVVNLVGSAAVVVPVPGLAAACGAAHPSLGLNLVLLGVIGGAGSTLGELTGYLAGYAGQDLARKSRHFDRINEWVVKRGAFALFLLAVIPNPVFDIAGIASGSLGYPLRKFLFWVGIGKIIKFMVFAIGCRQGVEWLTRYV